MEGMVLLPQSPNHHALLVCGSYFQNREDETQEQHAQDAVFLLFQGLERMLLTHNQMKSSHEPNASK